MGCSCNKFAKTCKRFYNNTSQPFAITNTTLVLLGEKTVNSGVSASVENTSIRIIHSGLFHVSFDIALDTTATAAGTVTLQLYNNGIAMPETLTQRTLTPNAIVTAHIETDIEANICCCNTKPVITLVASGIAGNVLHISGTIIKEA